MVNTLNDVAVETCDSFGVVIAFPSEARNVRIVACVAVLTSDVTVI